MKKNKITFLIAEFVLALWVVFFIKHIFAEEEPQKRVAVIVENSGDEKWDSFINGMKQAAATENIHLIICNTDEIENAEEEQNLIHEQFDNRVDAFIVQAAPGDDVMEMLKKVNSAKPVLLVENDVLTLDDNRVAENELAKVMPDNYDMGYQLGIDLLRRNGNDIKGKKVGIVNGLPNTDYAIKRRQGFLDALADSGCEICYDVYTTYDIGAAELLEQYEPVDFVAALETESLEQLGETLSESETTLYGIGNSIKCVYYLDEGMLESLVMIDGYDMGYNSVMEISRALENKFYTMKNHTTETRLMHKEDIFTEENQLFLQTYD